MPHVTYAELLSPSACGEQDNPRYRRAWDAVWLLEQRNARLCAALAEIAAADPGPMFESWHINDVHVLAIARKALEENQP